MGSGNAKEISFGDGFGEIALKGNGATVEVHADGSIAAHTAGDFHDAQRCAAHLRVQPGGEVRRTAERAEVSRS